jgi:hypothetical protein
MNKQAIIERLSADEDRCKYCNSSTVFGGDIYCSAGYSHDMNCDGKEFKLDYKIEEVISALEKQIPKKPEYDCHKHLYICPHCGEYIVTYNQKFPYDMKCGGRLEW